MVSPAFDFFLPHREAGTIHRYQAKDTLLQFKLDTGMNRPGIGLGDGKESLPDHRPEQILRKGEPHPVADRRQFGIFPGGYSHDSEFRHSAADQGVILIVTRECDILARQPADDVTEQPGGEDDLPGFIDLGFNRFRDAHFQVIAGQKRELPVARRRIPSRAGRVDFPETPLCTFPDGIDKGLFVTENMHTIRPFKKSGLCVLFGALST